MNKNISKVTVRQYRSNQKCSPKTFWGWIITLSSVFITR